MEAIYEKLANGYAILFAGLTVFLFIILGLIAMGITFGVIISIIQLL
ncbi:MAG: hypothetical protein SCK28_02500 [Bacillota bacterium]|nr:hypothetical protein [Bacillota bacterium]